MQRALVLALLLSGTIAHATTTHGILPADETWSGSVHIDGDVTIPLGRTLTSAPGAVITFTAGDFMGSGVDTGRTEIIVNGTLNAQGAGISLSGSWYGVRALAGSSV